ncbi:MAG: insulinase family protein, partial [Pseudomonadota bacterium]
DPSERPARAWPTMPDIQADTIVRMEDETVQQPSVNISLIGPNAHEDKKNAYALEVLQEIMSGGSTSRIYKSLVKEKKIASQAGLYYDSTNLGPGVIQLYAAPLPDKEPDAVIDALIEEVKILLQDGITDAELTDAKNRLIDRAIYARDSLSGPAMVVGRALSSGIALDDIEYWPDHIKAVSRKDIEAAAARYLNTDKQRKVFGYLLPNADEEAKATDNTEDKEAAS